MYFFICMNSYMYFSITWDMYIRFFLFVLLSSSNWFYFFIWNFMIKYFLLLICTFQLLGICKLDSFHLYFYFLQIGFTFSFEFLNILLLICTFQLLGICILDSFHLYFYFLQIGFTFSSEFLNIFYCLYVLLVHARWVAWVLINVKHFDCWTVIQRLSPCQMSCF